MRERCRPRHRRAPTASCPAVTSWSSTAAFRRTADQLARWKPATAHNRYRGLHAFFKWAVAEGNLETNPMEGMRPPQLPEQPVEVVGPDHLARLVKTCEGCDFSSRRDTAIILLLVDTGMRRAECVGMTLDDVDLDQRIVWVLGKGRRPRALPIGRKTAQALDATYGHEKGTAGPPAAALGRPQRVYDAVGCYRVVHDRAGPLGYQPCIPTSSGMPSRPVGWPRVAMRTS
jgi:site-specific recombinase XerC